MNKKTIEVLESESFEIDDSAELPPDDIVAYNELRSCADLFRMKQSGILEIQPEFQREIVWQNPGRTRFIDSLIKQLPIPSMCFSLDYKTQQWQVIDGLQRISTIISFLGDENWILSRLEDVDPKISGVPVRNFRNPNSELYKLYTRIENLTLPVTVLRCDLSKKSHSNYMFTIFHRLNTGGMKLNNQEIRNCIFSGPFNKLLRKLATSKQWKQINKSRTGKQGRMQSEEVILRLFAFNERLESYSGRLAKFLNDFMLDKRYANQEELDDLEAIFNNILDIVLSKVFSNEPPPKMTVSVLETILVGVARNLDSLNRAEGSLLPCYQAVRSSPELSEETLRAALADTSRVKNRLFAGIQAFSIFQ